MRAPGRSRGNCKNPALTGGSGDPRIRFTLPFRETITIRDNRASRPTGWRRPDMTADDRRRGGNPPGSIAVDGRNSFGRLENGSAGFGIFRTAVAAFWERGRRRTRQDQISWRALSPVKLRTRDPHRTKKTSFFCRTGFRKSELLEITIQPFDLMSRRHPLSSTRAAGLKTAPRSGMS